MENRYLVAGCKPWNKIIFDEVISLYPGTWKYIDSKDQLTTEILEKFDPRYIFFLHWSWLVPEELLENYECVCFHMTDVPYGRGGSPLQNLIVRGHKSTKLTALRMEKEFDAGPVYMKKDLSLEGSGREIYIRATRLAADVIGEMIDKPISPKPQEGEPVIFARRKPSQSRIVGQNTSLSQFYDFIRMLDAEGYPPAFIDYDGFRLEFSQASVEADSILANVVIKKRDIK